MGRQIEAMIAKCIALCGIAGSLVADCEVDVEVVGCSGLEIRVLDGKSFPFGNAFLLTEYRPVFLNPFLLFQVELLAILGKWVFEWCIAVPFAFCRPITCNIQWLQSTGSIWR